VGAGEKDLGRPSLSSLGLSSFQQDYWYWYYWWWWWAEGKTMFSN